MHAGEPYSGGPDLAGARGTASELRQPVRRAGQEVPGTRWLPAVAWIGGGIALFAFSLRISLSHGMNSDGANNALQGWDMLHGNPLLHGWIIGDATYYTLELPLYVITEALLGLHSVTNHVVSTLTYLMVAAFAAGLAMADSRGLSRVARCAAVIAVLAVPLLNSSGTSLLLAEPDHAGTAAIMLASFLLIDRAPGWRFTSPLLCVILCAGQIGDATVRYVAVPAILLVCAYRVLAARKILTADTAILLAAAASLPLTSLIRAVMKHFGGFAMVAPQVRISPTAEWQHHAALTLVAIRNLFGDITGHSAVLGDVGTAFGLICLLAAAFGLVRVVWTWRTASRSEQLLCIGIVINVGAFVISTMPRLNNPYEVIAVLPFGAVLAARACVPARIAGAWRARMAIAGAAVAALLPLTAAATVPPAVLPAASVAAWLKAHGLTYGIAGYFDASAVTVQSSDQVQVRAVEIKANNKAAAPYVYAWEEKSSWYDPSQHDATFVIGDSGGDYLPAQFERCFGRPDMTHQVAGRVILIYKRNLLKDLRPGKPRPLG